MAEGHGILLDLAADQAALWVADPGFKLRLRGPERIMDGPQHGRVLKLDLAGSVLLEIGAPDHPVYQEKPFQPTGLTFAGPPDDRTPVGRGRVRRPPGPPLHAGRDVAGRRSPAATTDDLRFETPHAVFVDDRGAEPELLVTDRARKRIQVFDLDGCFKRVDRPGRADQPRARSPAWVTCSSSGELNASLAVLDPDGRLVGRIGDRPEVVTEPDWPNARDADGNLVRTGRLQPGFFHAPHGLSVGPDGSHLRGRVRDRRPAGPPRARDAHDRPVPLLRQRPLPVRRPAARGPAAGGGGRGLPHRRAGRPVPAAAR